MRAFIIALGLFALSCDDTQYVNPDTVALIVTDESSGVERVNRCHYIPVLLGSQVKSRYVVEGDLRVTLSLTRDELDVRFESSGAPLGGVTLPSQQFSDQAHEVLASPPSGFIVELASPCTPQDF